MKVAINVCFGGFSLSLKAQQLYLEKKGQQAFFYRQTAYRHDAGENAYEKVGAEDKSFFVHTLLRDLGDQYVGPFPEDCYWSGYDIGRSDPLLIEVIEELGDAADGPHASLQIVEIPDGVEWEIDEYDGNEHIAEKHRTWR